MTTHNKDKIIAAAKDAGMFSSIPLPQWLPTERFYAIAFEAGRQAEREECANVCEILGADYKGRFGEDDSLFLASSECADAIRARSTK